MMNNNGFMGFYDPNQNQGFAVQSGLAFANSPTAKSTSSTPEELNIIKSRGGSNFEFNENDTAIAGWDYRDGTQLCIELVDASTNKVRAKWTGEEFNITNIDIDNVNKIINLLHNIVCTTKLLNTSLDKDVSKQLYIAAGIIEKLLPIAYVKGQQNFSNVVKQTQQQVGMTGFNGYSNNPMMWNGQFGQMPNYYVNDNSVAPGMPQYGFNQNFQPQQPQIDPNTLAQAAAILAAQQQMGSPTQPNGGTMMGNPFVQNGQPQQVPQMNTPNIPSVPFPGQPNTANPAIGGTAATTASSPF